MPGGDRTGPWGMGPMTGRAAGFCTGYPAPGYAQPAWGRGFGMRFGRGRGMGGRGGWGRYPWFYAPGLPGRQRPFYGTPAYTQSGNHAIPFYAPFDTPYASQSSREEEISALKDQANYLEEALLEVKRSLAALEGKTAEE